MKTVLGGSEFREEINGPLGYVDAGKEWHHERPIRRAAQQRMVVGQTTIAGAAASAKAQVVLPCPHGPAMTMARPSAL